MERVTISVGPVGVSLDPSDGERVCKYEREVGFEPESLRAWSTMATSGLVLDVGAYTGLFAIAAAKLGARKVIAIEPMPAIRKRLVQNLVYNGVRDKVSVVFAAASNQDGVGDLTYTPAMEFTAGASLSRALSAHPLHRRVDLIKIDSLVPYDVTAMKIDVERHEIEVLEGAKDTIERCRPRLIIECFETDRREQISEMLPNYAPPIEMDGRNVLYEPQ